MVTGILTSLSQSRLSLIVEEGLFEAIVKGVHKLLQKAHPPASMLFDREQTCGLVEGCPSSVL